MRGTLKLAAVVAGVALPAVLIAAPAQAGTPKGDGVMVRHYPCNSSVVPPNLDPISENDRTPRFDDRGVRSAPKTCRPEAAFIAGALVALKPVEFEDLFDLVEGGQRAPHPHRSR